MFGYGELINGNLSNNDCGGGGGEILGLEGSRSCSDIAHRLPKSTYKFQYRFKKIDERIYKSVAQNNDALLKLNAKLLC